MGSFHISCGITQHRIEMNEEVIVVPYLRNVLVKEDLDFQNDEREYRNVFSTELFFSYDIKPILATYDDYGRCLPKIKGENAEEIITQCNLKFFLEKVLKYCVEVGQDDFKKSLEKFLSEGELLKAWKLTTDKIQDKELFVDGGIFSSMLQGLKQVDLFVFKKDCFDWIDKRVDSIRNNFAEKYPSFKDKMSDMDNNLKTLSPVDYGLHHREVWFLNSVKPSLEGYIKALNLIEDHLELNDKDFEEKMDHDLEVKFDRNLKVLDLIKIGQNKRIILKEELKNKTIQEKFAILYKNNLILSHYYDNYNVRDFIEEMARKTNYLFEHFDIKFNQNNLYRSENIDPSLDFIKLWDYCKKCFLKRIKEEDEEGDFYSYVLEEMEKDY